MRIGLVVERFDPLRGGLEQWTYRFAQQLAGGGTRSTWYRGSFPSGRGPCR